MRFLGTAAAEAYPSPFCRCRNCETARRNRGRDLRRRAALLINDDLLLDFGPDVFQAFQQFGLDATRVTTLLITHAHGDHLLAENLEYRSPPFSGNTELPPLTIYGPQEALDLLLAAAATRLDKARARLLPVAAGDEVQSDGYRIRVLPAQHGGDRHECLLYLIERQGRRFLYGTDTGVLVEPVWQALASAPPDLAILDSTMGTLRGDFHMGIGQVVATAERLRRLFGTGVQVIAHHFSHNANPSYEELVRVFAAHDIRVSYDGMLVTLG